MLTLPTGALQQRQANCHSSNTQIYSQTNNKAMRELKFDNDYYKDILEGIEECNKRAVKMVAKDKGISEDKARKIIEKIQQC